MTGHFNILMCALEERGYETDFPDIFDDTGYDHIAWRHGDGDTQISVKPIKKMLSNGHLLYSVSVSVHGERGRGWMNMEYIFWGISGDEAIASLLKHLDTTIARLQAAWVAASQQ